MSESNSKLNGELNTLKQTNLFIQKELTNWPLRLKAIEKEKLALENQFKLEAEDFRNQNLILIVKRDFAKRYFVFIKKIFDKNFFLFLRSE